MIRTIVTTTGKKIYKKLPKPLQEKALKAAAPHIYKLHTRGIVANQEMVAWVKQHGRPVSIVIPSYNDYPLLKACLESIDATCRNFDYEVIVVDDYCQPANRELLRTLESDRVRVIYKEQREGFAKAVNRGMTEARHDILLLNSDIVAQEGWLEALQYSAYEIDPKIGMVSPKLVYPDGRIQYGGTYYARVLAPQWFGHLFVGRAATTPVANVPFYNRSISGACVYITRKTFDVINTLDDTYWLGFEDVDYGLKGWTKGFRNYYQPAAMLIHHESASRGYSQGKRELASMRYFWSKWSDLFLTRTLEGELEVDYISSDAADPLWRDYIQQQAKAVTKLGLKTAVHQVKADVRDEVLIGKLAARKSVKVCTDWGAVKTAWLAGLDKGKLVYLLPAIESGYYADRSDLQAMIIAQYRPEFDYIAPNRWVADQLRAETAWESSARVVPALQPAKLEARANMTILAVGAQKAQQQLLDQFAKEHALQVIHCTEADLSDTKIAALRAERPRAVVSFLQSSNSLAGLALMSIGAGYVGYMNDKTRYEVLDGYNALLVNPGDDAAMLRSLQDVVTDDQVWQELRRNGHETAARYASNNAVQFVGAIEAIARTAV